MVRIKAPGKNVKEYVSNKAEIYAHGAFICENCRMIIAHDVAEWPISGNIIPKNKNLQTCTKCGCLLKFVKKDSIMYSQCKINSKRGLCYG